MINEPVSYDLIQCILSLLFILFKDKSSYENCFACIFGISCIGSCF